MHFDLKDVITISIAAVGAVLGVINTWFAIDQRRVRLRVVPKMAHPFVGGEFGVPMGCIEVVNLSAFEEVLQLSCVHGTHILCRR